MTSKKIIVRESQPRKLMTRLLFAIVKYRFRSRNKGLDDIQNPERNEKANQMPAKLGKDLHIESDSIDGYVVHTLSRKDGNKNNGHLVYFHGGAYVAQAVPEHWAFLEKLTLRTAGKVTYVQYPLAPESNHNHAVAHALKVTEQLRLKHPDDNLLLGGDSAGAGLSLVLMQALIAQRLPQPYSKILLVSPWLNPTSLATVSKELIEKDILLTVERLTFAAESYAGGDELAHPHVSPSLGAFNGFPEIGLWMGGCDLFYDDVKPFLQKLESEEVDYTAYLADHMIHDYPLVPVVEGGKAVEQIVDFLLEQ